MHACRDRRLPAIGNLLKPLFALALAGVVAGCALPGAPPVPGAKEGPPELRLKTVAFEDLPGWTADDPTAFLPVFLTSCGRLDARPADAAMGPAERMGTVAEWRELCAAARGFAGRERQAVRYFLESNFEPFLVTDRNDPDGLFTGYYEAELDGAWQPGGRYTVPIHARPDDLVSVDLGAFRPEWAGETIAGRLDGDRLVPFPTRAEIARGALSGRQLEILWVDDPVDAFFLHIQGSGRVRLANGGMVRLGYAGRNGHRYVSVGRALVAEGIIPHSELSMQSIRAWMNANPVAARALMDRNPSYVFFRVIEESSPVGAQGVPLTPGRSLAVDPAFVPYGMPLWLDTTDPLDPERDTPLRRLVVAQDTGSAIKGVVRGDLFWGFGDRAALAAGDMKERGRYYMLLPKRAPEARGSPDD